MNWLAFLDLYLVQDYHKSLIQLHPNENIRFNCETIMATKVRSTICILFPM